MYFSCIFFCQCLCIFRYNTEVKEAGIDTKTAAEVQDWFHKFFNSINASSHWFEVSAKGSTRYKECEGDITLQWKGQGFQTIFDVLKVSYGVHINKKN